MRGGIGVTSASRRFHPRSARPCRHRPRRTIRPRRPARSEPPNVADRLRPARRRAASPALYWLGALICVRSLQPPAAHAPAFLAARQHAEAPERRRRPPARRTSAASANRTNPRFEVIFGGAEPRRSGGRRRRSSHPRVPPPRAAASLSTSARSAHESEGEQPRQPRSAGEARHLILADADMRCRPRIYPGGWWRRSKSERSGWSPASTAASPVAASPRSSNVMFIK